MILDKYPESYYPLEKALATLNDGLAVLDRKNKIIYINHEGQQIFERKNHLSPDIGDNYLDFVDKTRHIQTRQFIQQAFEGRTNTFILQYLQLERKNWFEITFYPIIDDDLSITHICLSAKNITDKVLLEQELERYRRKERRKILKAVIDAQERERAEIGKELHDNINQTLTTVKLYNEIALKSTHQETKLIERSISILNHTINEIRQISKQLLAADSDTLTLKDLIQDLIDSINFMNKVQIHFSCYELEKIQMTRDVKIGIFRIIQEHINNILKHAQATVVNILISYRNTTLLTSISDNGVGFDIKESRKGIGLTNMNSRAEALNGSIDIQSYPGQGCRLFMKVPITKSSPA